MSKRRTGWGGALALVAGGTLFSGGLVLAGGLLPMRLALANEAAPLKVTSAAFSDEGAIPPEYTCDGKAVLPPLSWSAPPPNSRSLAVLVDDPDAPGGEYHHFAAFNLRPEQRALVGADAAVATARNSKGEPGYAPICPPHGQHHYRFEVLALDRELKLPDQATAQDVSAATRGHVVAKGEIVGLYGKK